MPTWMGIDIGTTAVKVAVLKSTYRKTAVVALTSVDVVEAGSVADAIKRATSIAFGGKAVSTDGVAVAIEGSRAAVRTLTLPASAQKQLTEILAFELEAQVPFEMETSVFDYRVLPAAKDAPAGDAKELHVLAAVARTEDVRARIELVKSTIGLEPERVGVGAFPLANLASQVPALAEEGPLVVVDIGTKASEVLILKAGEPVFARTVSTGTEGLPASAPRLAREIKLTIAAYRAQGGTAPTFVYLCGGGAFMTGAEGYLGGELDMREKVEILVPTGLDFTAIDQAKLPELPRFAKALGLGLSIGRGAGLNLRKGPLAYERGFAWIREKVPVLAGLAAVILVSFVFSTWSKMHALSVERDALESALGAVTKEVLGEETRSASAAEDLLTKQTALNDEDPLPHGDAFDVMVKLSDDIPQSIKHDIEELDFQKAHAAVHGIVGTIPDAQSIAASLRSERCFTDVKITRTVQQPGSDRQKYAMEFDLKCPEDIKEKAKKKSDASTAASSSAGGK